MIERQKGVIIFVCDFCGDDYDSEEGDFFLALEKMKEEGWIVKRNQNDTEWIHICHRCATGGID